jgi:ABC-2 type transport system permease protein
MFLILYFIFVEFLHVGKGVEHWPAALFLGLVMWEFFSEVTKQGLKAVVSRGGIIRKINFPKYIIVVSSSISAFINLLINLVIVGVFVFIMGVPLSWTFLLIPIYIIELYIFSLGLAFVLATMYVKIRDVNFIWEIIVRAGFYAVGVLFPMSRIFGQSELAGQLLLLNPVAQSIQDARHALLGDALDPHHVVTQNVVMLSVALSLTFLTAIVGVIYFRRRSAYFAEDV